MTGKNKEPEMHQILVVEDEAPIARALDLKLKAAGFGSTTVKNGAEALEAIKKNRYSLILLDLMMPKMDGFEVLKALRSRKSEVPVIVLTNLSQSDDEKRARALGVREYFVKSDTAIAVVIKHIQDILK